MRIARLVWPMFFIAFLAQSALADGGGNAKVFDDAAIRAAVRATVAEESALVVATKAPTSHESFGRHFRSALNPVDVWHAAFIVSSGIADGITTARARDAGFVETNPLLPDRPPNWAIAAHGVGIYGLLALFEAAVVWEADRQGPSTRGWKLFLLRGAVWAPSVVLKFRAAKHNHDLVTRKGDGD